MHPRLSTAQLKIHLDKGGIGGGRRNGKGVDRVGDRVDDTNGSGYRSGGLAGWERGGASGGIALQVLTVAYVVTAKKFRILQDRTGVEAVGSSTDKA